MEAVWAPLATILVAALTGLGAWLVARHKGSGTIKTSEASELWKENHEFRQMLIAEARARTAEVEELRKRLAAAEAEIIRLKRVAGETP